MQTMKPQPSEDALEKGARSGRSSPRSRATSTPTNLGNVKLASGTELQTTSRRRINTYTDPIEVSEGKKLRRKSTLDMSEAAEFKTALEDVSSRDLRLQVQYRTKAVMEDLKIQKDDEEAGVPEHQRSLSFDAGNNAILETDVHIVTIHELEARFKTNRDKGLTSAQAAAVLDEKGRNVLTPPKELPPFVRFLLYLFEGFGPLLWVGAVLCFIAYYPLSYRVEGGAYNLALSICLVLVIIISGT